MISRETYIGLVCRAIGRLHPDILIHRLSGEAPRARHLAPDWARDKTKLLNDIQAELERRNIWQGCEPSPQP
jgi:radical SAM superfamily enzyme